jgi:hypothetical protein
MAGGNALAGGNPAAGDNTISGASGNTMSEASATSAGNVTGSSAHARSHSTHPGAAKSGVSTPQDGVSDQASRQR